MIIFGDRLNTSLSESIGKSLNLLVNYPEIHDFSDGEFRVRLATEVTGKSILVARSFAAPVERNLFEFLFIVDACKRLGADKVYGICPYLPYMRADHVFRSGEAVPLEVMSDIFDSLKLASIWTIDPHSIKLPEMFTTPVTDASAMSLFAEKIREDMRGDLSKVSVVSPDMGGIRRIKILADMLGVPYVTVQKDRDLETGSLRVAKIEGALREHVYLVDDMISTGGTMVQAASHLLAKGAKHATLMATHAVFAPGSGSALQNAPVEKVVVTDSISIPAGEAFDKLDVLTIGTLVADFVHSL